MLGAPVSVGAVEIDGMVVCCSKVGTCTILGARDTAGIALPRDLLGANVVVGNGEAGNFVVGCFIVGMIDADGNFVTNTTLGADVNVGMTDFGSSNVGFVGISVVGKGDKLGSEFAVGLSVDCEGIDVDVEIGNFEG